MSCMEDAEALARAQAERAPAALARAEAAVAGLGPRGADRAAEALLKAASRTQRRGKRIRLILEAGSSWVEPLRRVSACREGCAACCHLPVTITSAEAMVLSQASGRVLQVPPEARRVADLVADPAAAAELMGGPEGVEAGPCPLLAGERCSVYEARPMACRLHLNLDVDALLCQVVPGRPAQVPYADTRLMLAQALMLQEDEVLADIRSFFPADDGALQAPK